MTTIIIRDACQYDIPSITLLMYDLGYPATEAEMQTRFDHISCREDYRMLVAVAENNEVAGMIGLIKNYYFEHNGLYVRVGALVVGKNYRGMGIGKKLMMEAENWGAEIGANSILLNSGQREDRLAAYAFYQKIGYEIKSSGFIKKLNHE